jgi:hypothetical protein
MVSKTPSTPKIGLRRLLTSLIVPASIARPSSAKGSVCTGINTPLLATSAFIVTKPSEGGVSIMTMS